MPHEIVIDGVRRALRDAVDIGRTGARVRLLPLANGDAAVITAAGATRDGVPLLGNLTRIARGSGAIIRSASVHVVVAWQARGERRAATPDERCRLCFGAFEPDTEPVPCACDAVFHTECDRLRLTCPGCGAARQGDAA